MIAARHNFVVKASWWAEKSPKIQHEITEHYARVDSNLSSDTFNVVIPLAGNESQAGSAFKSTVQHYGLSQKAFSLWVWDLTDTIGWQRASAKAGVVPDEMALIMAHPAPETAQKAPTMPKTIKKVSTADDVKCFGDTVAKVFGDDPEAQSVRQFYQNIAAHYQAHDDRYQTFLKLDDAGTPVSTICLFDDGATIGLYDMATIPEAQGQGHANILFKHVLAIAKERQKPIILAASDMGKGLYKKHGFQEVGDIAIMNLKPV